VGHLLLESCQSRDGVKHPEIVRPGYFENPFWRYREGDWFDADPCTDVQQAPAWYAPDLVRIILAEPQRHELACHTFSHIDCSPEHCPPEVFASEMNRCAELAAGLGAQMRSFVHPANRIGHLEALAKLGYRAIRSDRDVLSRPRQVAGGLWDIPSTMQIGRQRGWTLEEHRRVFRAVLRKAVRTGTVCHLWFHPSLEPELIDGLMADVFAAARELGDRLKILTMGECADLLSAAAQRASDR